MGKNTRRALLGFAAGALKGVSEHFRTKQMLEAEALKEQRLAAIRAEDRQATQTFQRELLSEQTAAQTARDEKLAGYQTERDAAQKEQREAELRMQLAGQREIAGMPARSAPRDVLVEVPDKDGKMVLRSVPENDPTLRSGLSGARLASQGAQYMNAETRSAEAAAAEAPRASQRPGAGGASKTPVGERQWTSSGILEWNGNQWVPVK
jgi:hypothetical protein